MLFQRYGVAGTLDASFRLYRAHFAPLLALSLMAAAPVTLAWVGIAVWIDRVPLLATSRTSVSELALRPSVSLGITVVGVLAASALASLVAGAFATAASAHIAWASLLGEQPDVGAGLRGAGRTMGPLVRASGLAAVAVGLGFVALVVPGIVALLGLAFVAPVVTIEGGSARRALARSWQLTRGRRWKILATLVLCGLVVAAATSGLVVTGLVREILGGGLAARLLEAALAQGVGAIGLPPCSLAVVVLYVDARVEHEALDIEMVARRAQGGGRR